MKMRVTSIRAMVAVVVTLLSCGGSDGIKIGLMVPLTGDVKTFGESTRNGAMIAFDEVNASGGINGKKLVIVLADDKNDPTEASNAASKLIDMDRVVAILGSVSSKCSAPLSDRCQAAGIPMITPTSTAPKVTVDEAGNRKNFVFRACFIDPFQGAVAARFAVESLAARTAAVLFDKSNDYSRGLAEFFQGSFVNGGGRVVAAESYATVDVDFSGSLTKIKQFDPDVLFLPDYYTKVGLIAKQARQLGLTRATLMGGDGWDSPEMLSIAGTDIVGGYFTNHYSPDDPRPEVQNWVERYEKKHGQKPDALATLGYDAALLLVDALRRAPEPTPVAIRDALAQTTDYPCVSGRITFDEWGNPIKTAAVLQYTTEGQRFVTSILP